LATATSYLTAHQPICLVEHFRSSTASASGSRTRLETPPSSSLFPRRPQRVRGLGLFSTLRWHLERERQRERQRAPPRARSAALFKPASASASGNRVAHDAPSSRLVLGDSARSALPGFGPEDAVGHLERGVTARAPLAPPLARLRPLRHRPIQGRPLRPPLRAPHRTRPGPAPAARLPQPLPLPPPKQRRLRPPHSLWHRNLVCAGLGVCVQQRLRAAQPQLRPAPPPGLGLGPTRAPSAPAAPPQ
jgi:hypothetical protein